MAVLVTHLPVQAGPTAAAHEAVPPEVGNLEGRHLAGDLPELGRKEDERPGELECRPGGDREKEGIVGGDNAKLRRENARGGDVGGVCGDLDGGEIYVRDETRQIGAEHGSLHSNVK